MSDTLSLFDQALKAEGVSGTLADLAKSIYSQESGGGKNTETSNRGAKGGMQILPATFGEVADKGWSIDDPVHNARAGIRYLKQLDKQAGGDPKLTAAGYYGGPTGLEKARKGVAVSDPVNPSYPNTLQYAQQVVGRMGGDRGGSSPGEPVVSGKISDVAVASAPASPGVALPASAAGAPALGNAQVAAASTGPDAWQTFLRTMPAAQKLTPMDFNFLARPAVSPMSIRPPVLNRPALGTIPNFAAFQAWKGRTQ